MRGAVRDSLQLADDLAGKNHAFCTRTDNNDSTRSLKAPQATFSPYTTELSYEPLLCTPLYR